MRGPTLLRCLCLSSTLQNGQRAALSLNARTVRSDEATDYSIALRALMDDDDDGLRWLTVLADTLEMTGEDDTSHIVQPADVETLAQAVQFRVVPPPSPPHPP